MLQPPTKFEVSRRHTFGFSINHLVTLTYAFWPRTWWALLRHSGLMSQHLSDEPRDFAILTFHACWWYGSSCSIVWSSYGLPFQKIPKVGSKVCHMIWHTFDPSINRPGDPDLWPFDLGTNFGVSVTFRSRVMDQLSSDGLRDLTTLNFDVGGRGSCDDTGLRSSSEYQVRSS